MLYNPPNKTNPLNLESERAFLDGIDTESTGFPLVVYDEWYIDGLNDVSVIELLLSTSIEAQAAADGGVEKGERESEEETSEWSSSEFEPVKSSLNVVSVDAVDDNNNEDTDADGVEDADKTDNPDDVDKDNDTSKELCIPLIPKDSFSDMLLITSIASSLSSSERCVLKWSVGCCDEFMTVLENERGVSLSLRHKKNNFFFKKKTKCWFGVKEII